MKGPVIVAGGGGDNAASAVGIGAVAPGGGFVSLGTSGVLFVVNDRFLPNPGSAVHAFCHALPGRWHQMSVMLSAASCLRWVTRLLGASGEVEMLAEVEKLDAPARAAAPIFLPYLSGERTPHNDPAAQGVFLGLVHGTDRAALVYSVIEGVAFGLADGIDALRAAGTSIGTLSLVGGGSRSPYWAQLIADLVQVRLQTHAGGETGAALGAARLGHLACGGQEASVCSRPPVSRTFEPSRPCPGAARRSPGPVPRPVPGGGPRLPEWIGAGRRPRRTSTPTDQTEETEKPWPATSPRSPPSPSRGRAARARSPTATTRRTAMVLGKRMEDQLRFAVCYWHTFCGTGLDPFGGGDLRAPLVQARRRHGGGQAQGGVGLRLLRQAGRALLLLPRSRRGPRGRHAAGDAARTSRPWSTSWRGTSSSTGREAALGHRQPVRPTGASWPARPPTRIPRSSPWRRPR